MFWKLVSILLLSLCSSSDAKYQTIAETVVNRTCDAGYMHDVAGFVDYWFICYCLSSNLPVIFLAVAVWVLFLMYLLLSTAQQYVGETIAKISQKITMTTRIFGVSFLAFSLVSADFFVAAAGVYHGENEIVFGGFLGSTLFVMTLGTAAILFAHPADVEISVARRPFFRDILCQTITILCIFVLWLKDDLTWWMALIVVLLYFVYLLLVVFGRWAFQCWRTSEGRQLGIVEDESELDFIELGMSPGSTRETVLFLADMRDESIHHPDFSLNIVADEDTSSCVNSENLSNNFSAFMSRVVWDGTEWTQKSIPHKLIFLLLLPLRIVRNLTIPTGLDAQWNKPIVLINCFTAPLFILLATETITIWIEGPTIKFPIFGISLCVSVLLFIFIYFTSSTEREPPYMIVLIFLSLFISSMWLYFLGVEIISILVVVCSYFEVSPSLAGLLVLSWANSFAPITILIKMVREGSTSTAIGSAFSLPMIKLLLCCGVAFLISIITFRHNIVFSENGFNSIFLTFCVLLLTVLSCAILIPGASFAPKKSLGIGLVIIYFIYLVVLGIIESGVAGEYPIFDRKLIPF